MRAEREREAEQMQFGGIGSLCRCHASRLCAGRPLGLSGALLSAAGSMENRTEAGRESAQHEDQGEDEYESWIASVESVPSRGSPEHEHQGEDEQQRWMACARRRVWRRECCVQQLILNCLF
ncbi:hypothetical protein GOP47_0029646 [Adiantum capillus-veneris]|nr:hypothetical protein GOP47_0029646 [Adiantum capillus-veneris]